jgi:FkbM family methyltransferase
LVHRQILGHEFIVRDDTIRVQPDYDDAWLFACALHAEVVFDVGANVGYTTLLVLLSKRVKHVVLVEANPDALSIAAENLIRNQLAVKVHFVSAFAGDVDNTTVRFWTVGAGAAGSIYPSHAKSAAKSGSFIEVPTITVDSLCDLYGTIPDLLKIDVEGAEYTTLLGSKRCAGHGKTRFLVEIHANPDMTMADNTANVLIWCNAVGYRAWYLAEGKCLENLAQIQHRRRCHLLLQPADWAYPDWLKGIKQSAALEDALDKTAKVLNRA